MSLYLSSRTVVFDAGIKSLISASMGNFAVERALSMDPKEATVLYNVACTLRLLMRQTRQSTVWKRPSVRASATESG